MQFSRHNAGILVLLYLALLGYLLIALPPKVMQQYQDVAVDNPSLAYAYLAVVVVGAVLLGAMSIWILMRLLGNARRKRKRRDRRVKDPSELSPAEKQQEIEHNLASGGEFADQMGIPPELREKIRSRVRNLEDKHEAERLEIVAFGTISSGKSSLLNTLAGRDLFRTEVTGGTTMQKTEVPWPGRDQVILADTPGLAEVAGENRASEAAEAARDADLVLCVVDGPLKHYELQLIEKLIAMEKRLLVCLNKIDWFDEPTRDALLTQINEQLPATVPAKDVVAVRSRGGTRRRVRVLANGEELEERIDLEPDIEPLARRLQQIVERDGRELLLANLLMQSRGLIDEAKQRVLATLDRRAEALIRKYMWAAGSATAVNPIPLLDLAGGGAISVKMVLDLAQIYRQQIDSDTVITLLGQLGKNLVAMLGATAASPAVASGIATLLKTVPGVGTIAGGLLQGCVQALVTLWIGRVFCEYFRNEMQPPPGGLAELARKQWEVVTSTDQIKKLVASAPRPVAQDTSQTLPEASP